METVFSILGEMGRVLVDTFTSPSFLLVYLLLFIIVAWQYRRLQKMSAAPMQMNSHYLSMALVSSLFGIGGGILGSILLVFLGIDLAEIGISQLWLAAIILMLIKPRFLCFAYAAGLLSISKLIFAYPEISIPQLMGLVAVLHMVESLLILVNGSLKPIPVYVKKQGRLCGGFNLQLFWPIPLVAMLGVGMADTAGSIIMPDWWPLLHDYAGFTNEQTYALLPVLAVLGYGEVSTTRTPVQAIRKSSLHLFLFSLTLLCLSVLASQHAFMLPVVALFSPLGHELVIWLGMQAENRPPLYTVSGRGIMILDVMTGTAAHRAGLQSQDIILALNGEMVNHYYALQELLSCRWQFLSLEIKRGEKIISLPVNLEKGQELGIILVPELNTSRYLTVNDDSFFSMARGIWRRFRR